VWLASPRPTDETLAAAAIAGVDGVLAVGGVQAVGAMTFGLCGVPACDVIVGPGNRWVTAAKQAVSARVGIDMLAGPSELLVIADESADASVVAADLLAQAEHDADAVPMLVTTSEELAHGVERELVSQLATLPTRETAQQALRNGWVCVVGSVEEAIGVSDAIGPEHLEIQTQRADEVASRVSNAGAAFIGAAAAEVLGDYGAGPNHTLPTSGTSRFRAGLSVFTFLRARTWMTIDDTDAAAGMRADAVALARMERLEAHARAAEARERPRVSD
jgi:phosphoribosyl-ATP pyrophosphohydrolase/phosphoribosyl-AMP cyclohydrolase/histidinol dehydrogenase